MEFQDRLYQIDDFSDLKIHGANKRQIAFVVYEDDYEKQETLLKKIISAVGLDPETDIAIITVTGKDKRLILPSLQEQSPFKHLFVFGLSANEVSLQSIWKIHHPLVSEQHIIHPTFSLIELAEDQNKKKLLWGYLQKIFK